MDDAQSTACPASAPSPSADAMRPTSIFSLARHTLLIAASLVVLLARVAVPAGWMPMLTASGGLVLAPCSGLGAMALTDSTPGHGMLGMKMSGVHMPCMDIFAHQAAPDTPGDRHPDPTGDHPCSGAGMSVALQTPPVALIQALILARSGIDNVGNDRYFLFHPIPQRTFRADVTWKL